MRNHTGIRRGLVLVVAAAIGAITAVGYLGGFLAPDRDARNLPIVIVDLDRATVAAGRSWRFGADVVRQLRAPNARLGDAVRWQVAASRDEARRRLREERAYAAIVIPADFSARIARIATAAATTPATIEVLTDPAAGSYAGAYTEAIATAAVDEVSRATSTRLSATLGGLGLRLDPKVAATVGRPVEANVTAAHATGARGGRGLAPFYFSVVIVVATLFATSALNLAVDAAAGRRQLSVLGRAVRFGRIDDAAGPRARLVTKLRLAAPVAVVTALSATAVALGPLAMTTQRPARLVAFAVLGALATATLTLAFAELFDLAGSVIAALVLVIYGVPASAGVYPVQAMPPFFRVLHTFLPLRYLTDGARALVYGAGAPGTVARATAVLAGYTLAGAAVATLAARYAARAEARADTAAVARL